MLHELMQFFALQSSVLGMMGDNDGSPVSDSRSSIKEMFPKKREKYTERAMGTQKDAFVSNSEG